MLMASGGFAGFRERIWIMDTLNVVERVADDSMEGAENGEGHGRD